MNLPCELVRDLLPSYADGLTGETTNALLKEHFDGCEACREALAAMRAPEASPLPEPDRKELDFLKKNRRRTRRAVLGALLGLLALVFGILAVRVYVVGGETAPETIAARVSVEGQTLTLDAVPMDSARAITNIAFREDGGVVTATVRSGLPSPLHRGDLRGVFEASQPITRVKLGDRILWDSGAAIHPTAAKLYETRHDYVGDPSANARSAAAAGLPEKFGPYTSELDTEQPPYVWHIRLEEPIRTDDLLIRRGEMRRIGFALLAVVGNLDEVRFEFVTADDSLERYSVTAADAYAFFGWDVKDCMTDVRLLDELVRTLAL